MLTDVMWGLVLGAGVALAIGMLDPTIVDAVIDCVVFRIGS